MPWRTAARAVAVDGVLALVLGACLGAAAPAADIDMPSMPVGAGRVLLAPRAGDGVPPPARGRTDAMARQPVPTQRWYSALVFDAEPQALYPLPLSVRAPDGGFEVALPARQVERTERGDTAIRYPHRRPVVVEPMAFASTQGRLARASDWAIDIDMSRGDDRFLATVAHGSPYAFLQVSRGDLRLRLPGAGARWPTPVSPQVLALRVADQRFAFFGPPGVRWEAAAPDTWIARLPPGGGLLSVAGVPDDDPATLALLARHAHTVVHDTHVAWRYDQARSRVHTTFTTTVRPLQGPPVPPLLGLYPHHWHANPTVAGRLGPAYDTVRGPIRLLAASAFETVLDHRGFVPYWPKVVGQGAEALGALMREDLRDPAALLDAGGVGTYWQGKGLQRLTKLMDVVEQQGDAAAAARLLGLVQQRAERWFGGRSPKVYFQLDRDYGTLLGHPQEFFSIDQMNDHHFHYGYWIRAMADVALRDPRWAARTAWGAMVDLMIRDIASTEREGGGFPFLRVFDPYEGHSWASGIGLGPLGNNQESSSEAANAWAGLILWGAVHGDDALRDLGIYLYATETEAIRHYWFDVHRLVLAPEYESAEVSLLFGAGYQHNTWWTDEPRQTKGINLLPLTTASTYLGLDPAFTRRSLASLAPETARYEARGKRADPPDIWQDVFAKYLALTDPAAALASWDPRGAVELGDTRTHTLHFLLSLRALGVPDAEVRADTPLYAVFRRPDGRRTHLAFNAGRAPIEVRFSDGVRVVVPPGRLVQAR